MLVCEKYKQIDQCQESHINLSIFYHAFDESNNLKKYFKLYVWNNLTFIYIRYIIEAEVGCDYFVCEQTFSLTSSLFVSY